MLTYFCPSCWAPAPETGPCPRCGADAEREWTAKDYVAKLRAALHHREPTTPLRAAWVLGRLQSREAVVDLMELAEHSPDLFLRRAAIEALGWIGGPESLPLLRMLARMGPATLRGVAAHAVGATEARAAAESHK